MQDKHPVTGKTGYLFEDTYLLHCIGQRIGGTYGNVQLFGDTGNGDCRFGIHFKQQSVHEFYPPAKTHNMLFVLLA